MTIESVAPTAYPHTDLMLRSDDPDKVGRENGTMAIAKLEQLERIADALEYVARGAGR